eukprot:scaffold24835_cov150-Skeletonema_dohrnii-CCMP3373.AAC.1
MTTPPRPTSRGGEGISTSSVPPTSDSRKGSPFPATTRGRSISDATSNSNTPLYSDGAKGGGGARGDLRSKLVRERSRSSAAFASSSLQQQQHLRTTPQKSSRTLRPPPSLTSVEDDMDSDDDSDDEEQEEEEQYPALFTNFCYRGMEVIFTAIPGDKDQGCHLLGIHARTRVPFQKCHFVTTTNNNNNNNTKSKVNIVELTSHPLTGWIFAADSIGN